MLKNIKIPRQRNQIQTHTQKKTAWVMLILIGFSLFLCINLVDAIEGDYVDFFDISTQCSNGGCYGITTDGTNIWVLDAADLEVHKYTRAGAYVSPFNIPQADTPWGITTDGTYIWVIDYIDDKVYKYYMDGTYVDPFDISGQGSTWVGITTDGNYIWTLERTQNQIYKYYMNGTYTDEHFSTSAHQNYSFGIATEGNYIYLLDRDDYEVYKFYTNGTYINSSFDISVQSSEARGITTDGNYIWIVDAADFKVYRYEGVKETISINLISPTNNAILSTVGINFTVNYVLPLIYNLTNATYYLWNSTGVFNNSVFVEITGTSNSTTEYIDEFVLGNYEWNVYACYKNATFSNCSFADVNYSFSIGASINTESYNNVTYETSNERFEANISLLSGTTLYLAELYYNEILYEGNILDLGNSKYLLSTNIDIPIINGSSENFAFYWKLTYQKEDNSFVFQNLTSHNQTVNQIQLGSCNGDLTTISLNFTAWNEEKLTRINGFNFKATFYYWLGSGVYMKNVSFNNPNIYEKNICINPDNVTYYLINSDIQYQANFSGYVTRNYYFENDTINNITQHVSLYLLNSSDSTSFILNVVDQNQRNVEDAFIYTQRYYPGLGVYKIVQIAKTDDNGKSVGFFKTEIVDYRFIIKKNNITELITQKQKVIPEETPYTLIFTIGEALDNPWANFDALEHLDYTLIFNSSTNITTFTYIDTSGEFTQARLIVKEIKYNQTDIVICNTTSTESSASLICDLSGYSGSFIAQIYIGRSPETVIGLIWITITTIVEIMGMLGLLLGWFIILVAGCAFFWHPIAGIVGINAAVIFTNLLGLISFSGLFIFGLLAVSTILIFILKD